MTALQHAPPRLCCNLSPLWVLNAIFSPSRCASPQKLVPLIRSLSHPTSPLLIICQPGSRCFVTRRSENLGETEPPELDCLCRRREKKNLCFHFQSLSSRLSHPQITAAPVQCTYVARSRLLPADRGLCFHAPVGSAGGAPWCSGVSARHRLP